MAKHTSSMGDLKEDADSKSTGARLRAWRHALGLSQSALAQQLGVDITTLRKYEADATPPKGTALAKAGLMGVDLNWLLCATGSMLQAAPLSPTESANVSMRGALVNALVELALVDQEKFSLLCRGFTARAQEATMLARLERAERHRFSDGLTVGD